MAVVTRVGAKVARVAAVGRPVGSMELEMATMELEMATMEVADGVVGREEGTWAVDRVDAGQWAEFAGAAALEESAVAVGLEAMEQLGL